MTHKEIAVRAFEILRQTATDHTTITYGELGNRIGMHHRPVPAALGVLWGWCEHRNYPHLNALVVNKKTGMPGGGYTPSGRPLDPEKWGEIVKSVYEFEWGEVEPPNP